MAKKIYGNQTGTLVGLDSRLFKLCEPDGHTARQFNLREGTEPKSPVQEKVSE